MKIAEGLMKIKDLKGKAAELQRSALSETLYDVLDEDEPTPSIEETLSDLVAVTNELSSLKTRIAKTNAAHGLTDKIHEMEQLRGLVSGLDGLARHKQTQVTMKSFSYDSAATKVRTVATYDVAAWTDRVNGYRDRIRELDADLQRSNWEIDLVD